MQTIADTLKRNSLRFENKEAIVYATQRLTFRELNQRVNRLTHALQALGAAPDGRIAVLSKNSHQYLEIYFAAAKLGLCVVPLNFLFSNDEIGHIIAESEVTCCFIGQDEEDRADAIRSITPTVPNWITLQNRRNGFLFYEDLLDQAPADEPISKVNKNQMAMLVFTSGTTGQPKGVMLSHQNVMHSALSMSALMKIRPTDVGCCVLPFYNTEVVNAICMLMAGGKVVINRNVDAEEILALIQNERCTHINLVPVLFNWLHRHAAFERYNISSLKLMTYSGRFFETSNLLECIQKYWKPLVQWYGSTETAGCSVTALDPEDHILEGPGSDRLASAGRALSGVKLEIVNNRNRRLQRGEIGEIVVKSRNIMLGYWKQPELTRQTLQDGWLHTGDVGYIDANGYLYVLGRKDKNIHAHSIRTQPRHFAANEFIGCGVTSQDRVNHLPYSA
ncbi:AMP-dependent synthetase and ligase (fragment) [Desulfosarcina cetonica]